MKVYECDLVIAYVSLVGVEFVIRHYEDPRAADCRQALEMLKRCDLYEQFKQQHPIYTEFLNAKAEGKQVVRFR